MLSSYPTCQGVSMRALLACLRKPPSVTGAFLVTPVLALLPPSSSHLCRAWKCHFFFWNLIHSLRPSLLLGGGPSASRQLLVRSGFSFSAFLLVLFATDTFLRHRGFLAPTVSSMSNMSASPPVYMFSVSSLALSGTFVTISVILRCLRVSFFSTIFMWSQSRCLTLGTGLGQPWRAAGMVMIFWMVPPSLSRY